MNRRFLTLAVTVTVSGLLFGTPTPGQQRAASKEEKRVRIIEGPGIESMTDRSAIIRWTTDTGWGGTVTQYGVVRYGTDPKNLDLTATSPNRWNKNLPGMLYRVRVYGLKPGTTYHYAVDAMLGNGSRARLKSPVRQFTTPARAKAS
jgi:hypothetical protein